MPPLLTTVNGLELSCCGAGGTGAPAGSAGSRAGGGGGSAGPALSQCCQPLLPRCALTTRTRPADNIGGRAAR